MQELIDSVNRMAQGLNEDELYDYIIERATELLKKEKEQMIDFYTWVRINDGAEKYFHYSDEDMLTEYLNK